MAACAIACITNLLAIITRLLRQLRHSGANDGTMMFSCNATSHMDYALCLSFNERHPLICTNASLRISAIKLHDTIEAHRLCSPTPYIFHFNPMHISQYVSLNVRCRSQFCIAMVKLVPPGLKRWELNSMEKCTLSVGLRGHKPERQKQS